MAIGVVMGCLTPAFCAEGGPSVYQVSPLVDGSVILATSLGSLIPYLDRDHLVHPRCPCDAGEVNGFDRHVIGNDSQTADVVSNVTLGLAIAAPPLLDYYALGLSRPLAEDLTVFTEAITVSAGFATVAKYLDQRPTPRVYAGQVPANDTSSYDSFYSGHTALTFSALSAAAMTANLRYHWGAWPWVVTAVIGLSVAEERVLAGQHFYTDVIMGTAAGTLFGVVVPLIHKLDSRDQTVSLSRVSDGMKVSWSRRL